MKLKALSLALAQTLLPTFFAEKTQTKKGNLKEPNKHDCQKREKKAHKA